MLEDDVRGREGDEEAGVSVATSDPGDRSVEAGVRSGKRVIIVGVEYSPRSLSFWLFDLLDVGRVEGVRLWLTVM